MQRCDFRLSVATGRSSLWWTKPWTAVKRRIYWLLHRVVFWVKQVPNTKVPDLIYMFFWWKASHLYHFSLYCVLFSISNNWRASGVPRGSCVQSHTKALKLTQENNPVSHGENNHCFPQWLLQGRSASRKFFSLMFTLDTDNVYLDTLFILMFISDSARFLQHSLILSLWNNHSFKFYRVKTSREV